MANGQVKIDKMLNDPIPRLIGTLSIPTILSMLVTSFYNMADTFFVGKLGTSATAAVGVTFSLMAIIQAVGFMYGHGSGNYISRKLGNQQFDEASKMSSTGYVLSILTGLLITIVGLLFLGPMVRLLGATDTIFPYAKDYARIILLGAPFMCASIVLNNQLRFQGSAMYSMFGIIFGAVLNIVLDPLFIFGFNMGIAGAAVATTISQICSFALLYIGTCKGDNLRIRLRNFTPSLYYVKNIIKGGFPSLCRQGLGSISTACLNIAAGGYGDAAIAAMSIVSRVSQFAASALIGFGQGFQPVCGFNYGAKKYDRVQEAFWFCVKVSLGFLIVISVIGFSNAESIIMFFRKGDMEVVRIGALALRFQCITFSLVGWLTICNMMLQTIGKTIGASILAMSRQGLFFLPALIILVPLIGLKGVQLAQPVADVFSFILSVPMGLYVLKEMKSN